MSLAIPRRSALPVAGVAFLVLVVLGFLRALVPTRHPLQGQIEAQEIHVSSKVPGRVGQVLVRPGDRVQAGAPLFVLDSPEVEAKVEQARAGREAAAAVAAKAVAGARPEEVEMARLTFERAATGADIARTTYDRVQAMFDQGVVARQRRDEAEAAWQAAEHQAQAARAQYEMAMSGARSEDRRAAEAQARQVAAVVREAEVALAETEIRAPAAGEVVRVQIQPGELAPQGFPVVTLVDLADVWAVLHVREDELDGFQPGRRHLATVVASGAEVAFVVRAASALPDFATWRSARPGGVDLRTFEIRLEPVTPTEGLRPGMSVLFERP
ncbi:MAG: efflux RND transporter periplasmic adaptor subunit [Gemmatimonadota bacterium]